MSRIDQINELLQIEIAKFIAENIKMENILITVSKVNTSPDLRNAKIHLSVLPDGKAGSSLSQIRKRTKDIADHLKKNAKIRKVPKLIFVFDPTGKHISELDKVFEEIEKEKKR